MIRDHGSQRRVPLVCHWIGLLRDREKKRDSGRIGMAGKSISEDSGGSRIKIERDVQGFMFRAQVKVAAIRNQLPYVSAKSGKIWPFEKSKKF